MAANSPRPSSPATLAPGTVITVATPYYFEVIVPASDIPRVQREFARLADLVRAALPDAAVVTVTASMGVTVSDPGGAPLDLSALPWSVADAVVDFLGPGCWLLPGPGVRGSAVWAAWKG